MNAYEFNLYLNSPAAVEAARASAQQRVDFEAARKLVEGWAVRTGRVGPRHSQTRQGIRRRIMKHGISSDYALKFA